MVLKWSPEFPQEVIENIFRHLEDTDIYIDDVGAFKQVGQPTLKYLMKSYVFWKTTDSKLTHSNVNGQLQKQIG